MQNLDGMKKDELIDYGEAIGMDTIDSSLTKAEIRDKIEMFLANGGGAEEEARGAEIVSEPSVVAGETKTSGKAKVPGVRFKKMPDGTMKDVAEL